MTGRNYVAVRDSTTLSKPTVERAAQKKDVAYRRQTPFTPIELAAEVWRPVAGHESRWQISSLGRIRNASRISKFQKPTKECLATRLGRDGYERFNSSFIDEGGKRWSVHLRVHRMVAMTFLPNPSQLPMVHHKDNDKLNNRQSNLKWVTAKENTAHALEQVPGLRESIARIHTFRSDRQPKAV